MNLPTASMRTYIPPSSRRSILLTRVRVPGKIHQRRYGVSIDRIWIFVSLRVRNQGQDSPTRANLVLSFNNNKKKREISWWTIQSFQIHASWRLGVGFSDLRIKTVTKESTVLDIVEELTETHFINTYGRRVKKGGIRGQSQRFLKVLILPTFSSPKGKRTWFLGKSGRTLSEPTSACRGISIILGLFGRK